MYSDIKQDEHEITDQLDQHIKQLVEKCQYQNQDEKKVCQTETTLPCSQTLQGLEMGKATERDCKYVTYEKLLEHAKQHECMVKDLIWHKASGGVGMQQPLLMRSRPSNPAITGQS